MKLPAIQILRAVAALAVLLAHIRAYYTVVSGSENSILSNLPSMLGYGAELFFTISGFLMAYLIDIGYKNFIAKRLLRIYPLFWIVAAIALLLRVFILNQDPYSLKQFVGTFSLFPFGIVGYPLGVEWTLIYEIFFYFLCAPFTLKPLRKYFPVFISFWAVIVLVANLYVGIRQSELAKYTIIFFQIYNLFFIAGAYAYYFYKRKVYIPKSVGYLLIIPIVCFTIFWNLGDQLPVWFIKYHLYVFLVCCWCALIGAITSMNDYKGTLPRLFERIGDYSYALYLVHVPIILVIYTLAFRNIGYLNFSISIVALSICIFVGWWVGKLDLILHRWSKRITK